MLSYSVHNRKILADIVRQAYANDIQAGLRLLIHRIDFWSSIDPVKAHETRLALFDILDEAGVSMENLRPVPRLPINDNNKK
jgi:hypothetical protein